MKAKRKLLCFLLSFFLLIPLSGESPPPKCASYSIVTQIEVLSRYHGQNYLRTYTQPEKMEILLNYLRFLRFQGALNNEPTDLGGDLYEIRIVYSDSSVKLYRQREYSFQDKGNRRWQRIDAKQAHLLYPLLLLLPEDADTQHKAGHRRDLPSQKA